MMQLYPKNILTQINYWGTLNTAGESMAHPTAVSPLATAQSVSLQELKPNADIEAQA
jgi:hypothetical protein